MSDPKVCDQVVASPPWYVDLHDCGRPVKAVMVSEKTPRRREVCGIHRRTLLRMGYMDDEPAAATSPQGTTPEEG